MINKELKKNQKMALPRIPKPTKSGIAAIESPVYDINVAYVASYAREAKKDSVIFNDGSSFYFDGAELRIVDDMGRKKHAVIISELLEPDKSLADHKNGLKYRALGTDVDSFLKKVRNGAYSMLFAIGSGKGREEYLPLENLEGILKPIEKIADVDKMAAKYGAFAAAYVLSGGRWSKRIVDELRMALVQSGLSSMETEKAVDVYNMYLEATGDVSVPGQQGLIQKMEEMGDSIDKNILFIMLNENFFDGTMGQWILKDRYKRAEEFGLGKRAIRCAEVIEKIADAEREMKSRKKMQNDLAPILKSNLSEEEKLRQILDRSSHDSRLHFEYLNPFENFYLVGPEQLHLERIAAISKEEMEAGMESGKYNDFHKRIFDALQAIRMAGSVKIMKGDPDKVVGKGSSYDPFRPGAEPEWTSEADMTFIGYSRHDEKKILDMFYEYSGLDPNKFPIYVIGIKNKFMNMAMIPELEESRDEHHLNEKIRGKIRSLDRINANTLSRNMLKRIVLHALWKLPKYETLCKDIVDKAIDYSDDKEFSHRERIWFQHYENAVKEKFPNILYNFFEQLILDSATTEREAPELFKNLVNTYSDILYYGLGMSRYDAVSGVEINRRKDFLKLYTEARFSLESQVHEEFMRKMIAEDAKWLDELAHQGIRTKLDELLFKHIYPSTDGLYRDIKTLIEDAANVDALGEILDGIHMKGDLCSEDGFIRLFMAKKEIDRIDADLFPQIMKNVISFSKKGHGGEWDAYISRVYDAMNSVMERYKGDFDEIIPVFERDLVDSIYLLEEDPKTGQMTRKKRDTPLEHILLALPKVILAVPEVLGAYLYGEVKKEVEKIPKPKEDDTGIGKGDSF